MEARLSAPVSARMLALAEVAAGTRLLDLATGGGEPALGAAALGATVVGIDLSRERLALAQRRASERGLSLTLYEADIIDFVDNIADADAPLGSGSAVSRDAAPSEFAGVRERTDPFNVITSRWGLMYFAEPARALRGICRELARSRSPTGVFVAAVWAEPEKTPWWSLPREVTARHAVASASTGAIPAASFEKPGPFRFAEPAALVREFREAGLAVVHSEEIDVAVVEAADGAGVVAWVNTVLTRFPASVPAERRAAWEADLAATAEDFARRSTPKQPGIVLGGVTRIVVARPQT
jgi:SAM-dependent methyltransferase